MFGVCETCTRGAGKQGDALNVHTGEQGVIVSSAYQNLPTCGYHVLQRGSPKKILDLSHFQVGE